MSHCWPKVAGQNETLVKVNLLGHEARATSIGVFEVVCPWHL
jgi:hypothetical protein